jgi:primase-polymerase (primpol)-like protein
MSDYAKIPAELAALKSWCYHRLEFKKDRKPCAACGEVHPHKIPTGKTGYAIKWKDPANLFLFEDVQKIPEGLAGISFVMKAEDGFVCVDLDGVRDPKTGKTEERAANIIERVDSYTE